MNLLHVTATKEASQIKTIQTAAPKKNTECARSKSFNIFLFIGPTPQAGDHSRRASNSPYTTLFLYLFKSSPF